MKDVIGSDISRCIFGLLSARTLVTCMRVCKEWKREAEAEELWTILYMKNYPYYKISRIPNLKEVIPQIVRRENALHMLLAMFEDPHGDAGQLMYAVLPVYHGLNSDFHRQKGSREVLYERKDIVKKTFLPASDAKYLAENIETAAAMTWFRIGASILESAGFVQSYQKGFIKQPYTCDVMSPHVAFFFTLENPMMDDLRAYLDAIGFEPKIHEDYFKGGPDHWIGKRPLNDSGPYFARYYKNYTEDFIKTQKSWWYRWTEYLRRFWVRS